MLLVKIQSIYNRKFALDLVYFVYIFRIFPCLNMESVRLKFSGGGGRGGVVTP